MARVEICDACQRRMGSDKRRVRYRHSYACWHEYLTSRGTLTLHEECWQSILRTRKEMVDKAMQEAHSV